MKSFVAVCGAQIGFVLGYVGAAFGKWPKIFFDPVHNSFHWKAPGSLVITYWGLWMWGIIGALVGIGVSLAIHRVAKISPERAGLLGAWTLTSLGFGVAYFAWHNWP